MPFKRVGIAQVALEPLRASVLPPVGAVGDDDMPLVLREIVTLLGAKGAIVSLHPSDGSAAILVHASPPFDDARAPLDYLGPAALPVFGWSRTGIGNERHDVLTLPVQVAGDHHRLIVSLMFRPMTETMRATASRAFETRRAVAMSYFRLWQQERIGSRRSSALEAACDATDLGIMLFSRSSALIYINDAVARLLDQGDGLRRHNGSVQAGEIGDSLKLQVALAHVIAANAAASGAAAERGAPLVRLHRREGKPLIAAIVPAEVRATEPGDVAAIVYIFDPVLDTERLLRPVCRIFALSPMEARLACLLAAGQSIATAAETLRIKEQTARSYLKNVFIKTDTNGQTQLVHLLLTNSVRIGRSISPEHF